MSELTSEQRSSELNIGVPKESKPGEMRIAISPDTIKKYTKKGFKVFVEDKAGVTAGFTNEMLKAEGAEIVSRAEAFSKDFVFKIQRPNDDEIKMLKPGSLLISALEPYRKDGLFEKLANAQVNAIALELIPRTSRAQSMDVLSSQANIAGYRAVLEATTHYPRFFPMMMTSAGSAKPASVIVLGAGVAGLQAIGTAKRLGANVEAYDVRPEVKEQILSLGAKFIEISIEESGTGAGGYAKELSEEGKKKQQQMLTEKLKKADVIITTANVPGRKAPILITEDAVKGMRAGSVIIDLAAPSGGNCVYTQADKIVEHNGVKIVGITDYPSLVACDASAFFARNIFNLVSILISEEKGKQPELNYNLDDDIIAAALVTYQSQVRIK